MKLIKSGLNFLQACQKLSTDKILFISRREWTTVSYIRYDEFDNELYEDKDKKFLGIDVFDNAFHAFLGDIFYQSTEVGLKITDVLAQDWEVWERE